MISVLLIHFQDSLSEIPQHFVSVCVNWRCKPSSLVSREKQNRNP